MVNVPRSVKRDKAVFHGVEVVRAHGEQADSLTGARTCRFAGQVGGSDVGISISTAPRPCMGGYDVPASSDARSEWLTHSAGWSTHAQRRLRSSDHPTPPPGRPLRRPSEGIRRWPGNSVPPRASARLTGFAAAHDDLLTRHKGQPEYARDGNCVAVGDRVPRPGA